MDFQRNRIEKEKNFIETCIAHGLFTRGDNRQYEKVTFYAGSLTDEEIQKETQLFELVVYMTWICSNFDKYSANDIREILKSNL